MTRGLEIDEQEELSDSDPNKLWHVETILKERTHEFFVKWAGHDSRGNPWPDEWVLKSNCTSDLIKDWNNRKKESEKQKRSDREQKRKARRTPKIHSSSNSKSESRQSRVTRSALSRGKRRRSENLDSDETDAPVTKKKRVSFQQEVPVLEILSEDKDSETEASDGDEAPVAPRRELRSGAETNGKAKITRRTPKETKVREEEEEDTDEGIQEQQTPEVDFDEIPQPKSPTAKPRTTRNSSSKSKPPDGRAKARSPSPELVSPKPSRTKAERSVSNHSSEVDDWAEDNFLGGVPSPERLSIVGSRDRVEDEEDEEESEDVQKQFKANSAQASKKSSSDGQPSRPSSVSPGKSKKIAEVVITKRPHKPRSPVNEKAKAQLTSNRSRSTSQEPTASRSTVLQKSIANLPLRRSTRSRSASQEPPLYVKSSVMLKSSVNLRPLEEEEEEEEIPRPNDQIDYLPRFEEEEESTQYEPPPARSVVAKTTNAILPLSRGVPVAEKDEVSQEEEPISRDVSLSLEKRDLKKVQETVESVSEKEEEREEDNEEQSPEPSQTVAWQSQVIAADEEVQVTRERRIKRSKYFGKTSRVPAKQIHNIVEEHASSQEQSQEGEEDRRLWPPYLPKTTHSSVVGVERSQSRIIDVPPSNQQAMVPLDASTTEESSQSQGRKDLSQSQSQPQPVFEPLQKSSTLRPVPNISPSKFFPYLSRSPPTSPVESFSPVKAKSPPSTIEKATQSTSPRSQIIVDTQSSLRPITDDILDLGTPFIEYSEEQQIQSLEEAFVDYGADSHKDSNGSEVAQPPNGNISLPMATQGSSVPPKLSQMSFPNGTPRTPERSVFGGSQSLESQLTPRTQRQTRELSIYTDDVPNSSRDQLDKALVVLKEKSEEILTLRGDIRDLQLAQLAQEQEFVNRESEFRKQLDVRRLDYQDQVGVLRDSEDYLRRSYNEISNRLSLVQKEKDSLIEENTILKGQVTTGVAQVKRTLEARIERLLEELEDARGRADLFEQQSARTSEVRRRAAEEPVLRRRVDSLEAKVMECKQREKEMIAKIQNSSADDGKTEQLRMTLVQELETTDRLRKINRTLRSEMTAAKEEWDKKASEWEQREIDWNVKWTQWQAHALQLEGILSTQSAPDMNDDEESVIVCRWAINSRGDWCGVHCPTRETLSTHLLIGHLHPTRRDEDEDIS